MCVNYIANQMLYWYGASLLRNDQYTRNYDSQDQLAQFVSRQVVIVLTNSLHSVQLQL